MTAPEVGASGDRTKDWENIKQQHISSSSYIEGWNIEHDICKQTGE